MVKKHIKRHNNTIRLYSLLEGFKYRLLMFIQQISNMFLPGVGNFSEAIKRIHNFNLFDFIKNKSLNNFPILGICLGMQLFGNYAYENNLKTEGLNLISGEIKKIPTDFKLPHIGWNEVKFTRKDLIKVIISHFFHWNHKKYKKILNTCIERC